VGVPYAEVIGDPITHSKSPLIHKFWLEKLGIAGDYRATRVAGAELPDYFFTRRTDPDWRGCNVTAPHKLTAMRLIDAARACAQTTGATNCIIGRGSTLIAHNTDCHGISEAASGGRRPVCIIGSGGAARAALAVFGDEQSDDVHVLARSRERGFDALDGVGIYVGKSFEIGEAKTALQNCGTLVNASTLGMDGKDRVPAFVLDALCLLKPGALVLDMVYAPIETDLLKAAHNLGFTTRDGLTMLVEQAAKAFELLFERLPPRKHDAELRELLTR
jgi:shikimate dehydrogenase